MDNNNVVQCEGWRRRGGMMTLGPVKWSQCENDAIVIVEVVQDGKTTTTPACMICWQEGIERNVQINKVTPI